MRSKVFCIFFVIIVMLIANTSSAKVDKASVVGIWLFDNESDFAVDMSKNGHDGELIGNVQKVPGKFGKALELPGAIDSYVSVPHDDSLNLTTFSFVGWLKMADPGQGYDGYPER